MQTQASAHNLPPPPPCTKAGHNCAGLRLLGFKPLAALRDFHQVRNPSFLYPDEALQSGATTAFVALHECLLEGECFALCSFIRTRAAEPQLVALLPQQELRDSYGNQVGSCACSWK